MTFNSFVIPGYVQDVIPLRGMTGSPRQCQLASGLSLLSASTSFRATTRNPETLPNLLLQRITKHPKMTKAPSSTEPKSKG